MARDNTYRCSYTNLTTFLIISSTMHLVGIISKQLVAEQYILHDQKDGSCIRIYILPFDLQIE